jgi:hypothetical protein
LFSYSSQDNWGFIGAMGNPECKLVVDDVDIIEEMNVTTLALGS